MNQVLQCFITNSYLWRWSFEAIPESRIVKWSLISRKTNNSLLFSFKNFTKRKYNRKQTYREIVIRTMKPWNSIQIGEEEGQFLETLVDSF